MPRPNDGHYKKKTQQTVRSFFHTFVYQQLAKYRDYSDWSSIILLALCVASLTMDSTAFYNIGPVVHCTGLGLHFIRKMQLRSYK